MDEQLKEQALKAVRTQIGKLPAGAPVTELSKAGDAALEPFLRSRQRRENKKRIIADGLISIYSHLQKLSDEWDFGMTTWALREELKKPICQQLEIELTVYRSGAKTSSPSRT